MQTKTRDFSEIPALTVPAAVLARRTVRHYRKEPVAQDLLDHLIELTLQAPSSWNLQDRHVVIVRDRANLAALVKATGGQPQPREAPVVVVFVAELDAHKRDRSNIIDQAVQNQAWSAEFAASFYAASQEFQNGLERRGALREYAIKDAMIAASFFMLLAASYGLATSPMNGWEEAMVKQAVGIEDRDDLAIALLVSLGHADHPQNNPGRQPLAMNAHHERFGESFTIWSV